jgi:hypothetical protein
MTQLNRGSSTPAPSRRPWRWFHWVFLIVVGVVLLVGAWFGFRYYKQILDEQELQKTVARLDDLDPNWRLEDIEANRAEIPEKKNGALQVLAASRFLPERWEDSQLTDQLREIEPPVRLLPEQTKALRETLTKFQSAVIEARKLVAFSYGRYKITWLPNTYATLLPHLDKARSIANLLSWDTRLQLEDKDLEGAMASTRAMLNTGRSIGDEPTIISMFVRMAIREMAMENLERTLAHGESSLIVMKEMQRLFKDEEAVPLLLIALRGERAGIHVLFTNLESGEVSVEELKEVGKRETGFWKGVTDFFAADHFLAAHVWLLDYQTEAIAIARKPMRTGHTLFRELEARIVPEAPKPLGQLLAPGAMRLAEAVRRNRTQLRCTLVSLALERYRQANKQWPDSLRDLIPKELTRIPLDPYDGAPLRYRKRNDGVVVYSIGPDGEDNGGNIDRQRPVRPGTDLGFRLWNPDKRRQPPKQP